MRQLFIALYKEVLSLKQGNVTFHTTHWHIANFRKAIHTKWIKYHRIHFLLYNLFYLFRQFIQLPLRQHTFKNTIIHTYTHLSNISETCLRLLLSATS